MSSATMKYDQMDMVKKYDLAKIQNMILDVLRFVGVVSQMIQQHLSSDEITATKPFQAGLSLINQGKKNERQQIISNLTDIITKMTVIATELDINFNGCIIDKWIENHKHYPVELHYGTSNRRVFYEHIQVHSSEPTLGKDGLPYYILDRLRGFPYVLYDFNSFHTDGCKATTDAKKPKTTDFKEEEKDFVGLLVEAINDFNMSAGMEPQEIFIDNMFHLFTNIGEKYVSDRAWHDVYTPRNLLLKLAYEVGELAEPFMWRTADPSFLSIGEKVAIADDVADVTIYCLRLLRFFGKDKHWDPYYEAASEAIHGW